MSAEFTLAELAKRDDACATAAHAYQDCLYAEEEFKLMRDSHLAALKMGIKNKSDGKISDAELEMRAMASDEWKKWKDDAMEKLREAGRKKIAYDNHKRRVEVARTALSFQKTERL